jgi:hypothetical protein
LTNTPIIDSIIEDLREKKIVVDVSIKGTLPLPTNFFRRNKNKIKKNHLGQKLKNPV